MPQSKNHTMVEIPDTYVRGEDDPLSLGGLRAAVLCHDGQLRRSPGIRHPGTAADGRVPLDREDFSFIISAFTLAYAIGYVAMGRVMDRIGVRRGFVAGRQRVERGGDGPRPGAAAGLLLDCPG